MIVIAVAGSLVTYAWVMGYLNFTTNKAGSALQIQSISYMSSNTTVFVYAQNVGQGSIILNPGASVLYIDGALQITAKENFGTTAVTLLQGQTATISVSYTVLAGQKVAVKVVANDGTFAENSGYPVP